jgi:hypothetical protein
MSESRASLDFGRAFRFVLDDPERVKKILMGSLFVLLSMFVIGGVFLAGYLSRLIQRTARGETHPLPAWDDLGDLFRTGLRAFGAYLLHAAAVFVPAFGIFMLVALMAGGMSSASRDAAEAVGPLAGLGFLAGYGLLIVGMVALLVYFPAALTRLALSERFSAAFEFQANLAFIRRNLMNYALAIVFYLVAQFLSQFGVLLCCVGVLPMGFWSLCVFGFALGETARLGPGELAANRL